MRQSALIFLAFILLCNAAAAQGGAALSPAGLKVLVLSEQRTVLTQQVLVRLRSDLKGTEVWQATERRSEVTFQSLVPGPYTVEVSAAGFITATETYEVQASFGVNTLTVLLKRDPSNTQPAPPPVSVIDPKARKDAERGIAALKAGDLKTADKNLKKAYKRNPEDADLNYLLGVLSMQKKELPQAQSYLGRATTLAPKHVRAMTMLGQVQLQLKDPGAAAKVLEQAITVDAEYWTAHSLLANAYLQQGEMEKCREQAELAIQTGKGAGNAARLPLGQALANLGRIPEAIAALEGYLQSTPNSPSAPQVTQFIAQLKADAANPAVAPRVEVPMLNPEPRLSIPNWAPPGVDEVQPPVAAGVACPQEKVIEGAIRRSDELGADLARFEASEEVLHEDLDELGKPITREIRKFSYVAAISHPAPDITRVNEYRQARVGTAAFPNRIATLGLPGLAFIFSPGMRGNYDMKCEGLGDWQGKSTWLVHFRQREDRPSRLHGMDLGPTLHSVDLKGRAWLAADTFQLLHIEAELVRPMPQIALLTEHLAVDYGAVTFTTRSTELWLPKSAVVHFHFRGHRYRRSHTFDNFKLFAVDASEKRKPPEVPPEP